VHCTEVGCLIRDGHCIRTIHAEVNAICNLTVNVPEIWVYSTHSPCYNCYKYLIAAGAKRLFYSEYYDDSYLDDIVDDFGFPIKMEHIYYE